MSDTTTSGDRLVAAGTADDGEDVLAVAVNAPDVVVPAGVPAAAIVGRSPGQLAWIRLRRDRSVVPSVIVLGFFVLVALLAPLIEVLYGQNATDNNPDLLAMDNALPLGVNGGMSGTHWFGVSPSVGRDVLMQLVYGLRTSLIVATTATIVTVALGVLVGIIAGYATGWVAALTNWFTDFVLAFPFLIFALAAIPITMNRIYNNNSNENPWVRLFVVVAVLAIFGWPYTARIVRGQVLSLREREFVEAARAAGASTGHMLFRQLLPNLWAPILVVFSLGVPTTITAEAALSFLNIGITEPTPDLGRMIFESTTYLSADFWFFAFPALTIFLLVLAFNLLGDSVRDALDPKSTR
jgi:peptide/nickel transport system permease protein